MQKTPQDSVDLLIEILQSTDNPTFENNGDTLIVKNNTQSVNFTKNEELGSIFISSKDEKSKLMDSKDIEKILDQDDIDLEKKLNAISQLLYFGWPKKYLFGEYSTFLPPDTWEKLLILADEIQNLDLLNFLLKTYCLAADFTNFIVALKTNKTEAVKLLVKYAPKPDDEGYTPVDVNTTLSRLGYSPLVVVINHANYELAEFLIKHGANVNYSPSKTPLLAAIEQDDPELIELLLKNGANVNPKRNLTYHGYTDKTPLQEAQATQKQKAITMLEEYDKNKWTLLAGYLSESLGLEDHLDIKNAFEEVSLHAQKHLDNTRKTQRGTEGNQKSAALYDLMTELLTLKGNDTFTKLTTARDIIEEHLKENTDKSVLLKNRGGFFGAYKKFSSLLNKLGAEHYQFQERTAVSSTDHYLIKLYDEIDKVHKSAEESEISSDSDDSSKLSKK